MKRRKLAKLLLLAVLVMADVPARRTLAQPPPPSQYDVQAVYLFDFAKFVRWPAGEEHDALTICVASQKIYADTLAKIVAGETINSRPLSVRMVDRPEDEAGCNLLFIGAARQENLDTLLAAAKGKPVLTVSDIPGFLTDGGMIQFLVIGQRVRFSVDLRAVTRSGISLDSQLLKVAVAVNGRAPSGDTP